MIPAEERSRRINLFRKPKDKYAPAVYDRLDRIQHEVELTEVRRKRDARSSEGFRKSLRAICLDLFCARSADPELLVGVSRDRSRLSRSSPDIPDFVKARTFVDALDGLIRIGYVEQVSRGNEGSGKSSRVRATDKLMAELGLTKLKPIHLADLSDPIRLKVGQKGRKKRIAFEDDDDTNRWRRNLDRINRRLTSYGEGMPILDDSDALSVARLWAQGASQTELKATAMVAVQSLAPRARRGFVEWLKKKGLIET